MRENENNVSAENQLPRTNRIFYMGKADAPTKILIVGNSITRHGPAPQIGWEHDWGMAATAPEKDYVHLLQAKMEADGKNVLTMVRHASNWERTHMNEGALADFEKEHEFSPDILLLRFGENVPKDCDFDFFAQKLREFVDYINAKNALVIVTTTIWGNPKKDAVLRSLAEERGYPCVELGAIGKDDSMMAIGLFEHRGVSIHPGDKGMQYIADTVYEELKKHL